ncbi:MAG: hypothetical protein WC470_01440 [Candidatus Paceibacterota bacterium]
MLKRGDTVTIIEKSSAHCGKQGRIVEIKNSQLHHNNITVSFTHPHEAKAKYNASGLRKDEAYSVETRARSHFGQFLSLSKMPNPLIKGKTICAHINCDNDATHDILVSCDGKVSQVYVCGQHGHLDGERVNNFPFKT